MATCGVEPLATGSIGRRLAAVDEVLRSVDKTGQSCLVLSRMMFIVFLPLHNTTIPEAVSLFVNKNRGCDNGTNDNNL